MATIAGLFANRNAAERAIYALRDAGFDVDRMGIVMRDSQDTTENQEAHRNTPETAHTGDVYVAGSALAGGVLGGALGAILAATGALVVPGFGPFIAGGILATALVGGIAGWLAGGLVGLGIPREQAEFYQSRVEQGAVLVTVDANGREQLAQDIMARNGAESPTGRLSATTAMDDSDGTAVTGEREQPSRATLESGLPRTAPLLPRRESDSGATPDATDAPDAPPPSGVADTTNTAEQREEHRQT